ncbi:2Fe-2S iron-sulfur cluster binding domain-containing protein [Mesorhizobium sp.]|uniref:2Fe-2S iron-sulfur cluster-binding protein n=1 Tax=Mesorhizobium sp. TaxID=1871066 RepID=UPI0034355DED
MSGPPSPFRPVWRGASVRDWRDPARCGAHSGLYIPTACQQGICGTCRTVRLSGEVAMDDLGGLNLEEKAAGFVLACCSRPQGTVCLDL